MSRKGGKGSGIFRVWGGEGGECLYLRLCRVFFLLLSRAHLSRSGDADVWKYFKNNDKVSIMTCYSICLYDQPPASEFLLSNISAVYYKHFPSIYVCLHNLTYCSLHKNKGSGIFLLSCFVLV